MHQFELIFQFGSYLSQKWMDFASIWFISKAKKNYIWNHGPDLGQDFGTGYNLGTA